jgi:hypothetical protein
MAKDALQEAEQTAARVYQVEDTQEEEKQHQTRSGFMKTFRQQQVPIFKTIEDVRMFRLISMPFYLLNGDLDETKTVSVRPWRFYLHQIPPKFVPIICSGTHSVLKNTWPNLDPENCDACEYAQAKGNERAEPRLFYYYPCFDCDQIEMDIDEMERRSKGKKVDIDSHEPEIILLQVTKQVYGMITNLGTTQGILKSDPEDFNSLTAHRICIQKEKTGNEPKDVKYSVFYSTEDIRERPELTKGELKAIKAFTVGEKSAEGQWIRTPDPMPSLLPTSKERVKKIIEEAGSSRSNSDGRAGKNGDEDEDEDFARPRFRRRNREESQKPF